MTITASGVGGMQRHTHDLVRGLVAAGHDVEVICPAAPDLAPELYGARWTLVDACGRTDRRWGAAIAAAYDDAQARAPFDVMHSESTSAAPLVRLGMAIPVVIMFHGNYVGLAAAHVRRAAVRPGAAPGELGQLGRMTWRYLRDRNAWAFRTCEVMVPSHQQVRGTAWSSLIRRGRVHVVPNGVDVSRFCPRDRASARRSLGIGDGLLLSAVGRLNREKGFDVALSVLARLALHHRDIRLVAVGGGEERGSLEGLAQRLGVADRVDFVGVQPPEQVARYLAASDIFLFLTRRDEAAPLVLPEALACGLPVVASRVGGIPEVMTPSSGPPVGMLVRPGSVAEPEAAVRRLLRNPGLRAELGAAARARAVDEYSLETMVARTVDVYRAAIAQAQVRR